MYVRDKMTVNPITVTTDETVAQTLELMRKNRIRRVPVMKNGHLAGIVTERRLLEVSPSPATTLSVYEINYILEKTKIETVMTKDVITITPDTLIEDAAVIMREKDVRGLPVMEGANLVGIITESDIFDAFIEIMGFRDHGSRIAVIVKENRPGVLKNITGIISDFNVNISHIVFQGDEIVLRLDTANTDDIVKQIEKSGYQIGSIYYFK